jgi:hypothetical protein
MTKLQSLSMKIAKLQAEFEEEKARRKSANPAGRYNDCTIYTIKETWVKAHHRRPAIVVRVKV